MGLPAPLARTSSQGGPSALYGAGDPGDDPIASLRSTGHATPPLPDRIRDASFQAFADRFDATPDVDRFGPARASPCRSMADLVDPSIGAGDMIRDDG